MAEVVGEFPAKGLAPAKPPATPPAAEPAKPAAAEPPVSKIHRDPHTR